MSDRSGNQPFLFQNVAMTGSWVRWRCPNSVNAFMVQLRTDVELKISDNADGANRFTLRPGKTLTLGSFNTNNQQLWFKAAAGTVLEIVNIDKP